MAGLQSSNASKKSCTMQTPESQSSLPPLPSSPSESNRWTDCWDPSRKRREYLTGFSKRKKAKQTLRRNKAIEREKTALNQMRKQVRSPHSPSPFG